MDPDMTSTTFTLAGHQIVESLGVVRGVTVRSRSLFGTIGAKIEILFGGQIAMLTTLCERTREDAFDILLAHDLVDELHLLVYPLTLGSGKRVLPDGVHATFGLMSATSYPTGVVGLHYARQLEQ